ncbi:FtsX-like permease family protein [Salinicoccus sp. Marseille-QA3877]
MAWKEMMKYKTRYLILGSIIFLISFLTLIISGLANGLSYDNASLVKNMPEGTYYMESEAEEEYNFSEISESQREEIEGTHPDAVFMSVQMGELEDEDEQKHGITYVTATENDIFPNVEKGEVILDESIKEDGIEAGDELSTNLMDDTFTVSDFAEQEKFSHSAVAFIHPDDFMNMYQSETYQLAFTEDEEEDIDEMSAFNQNQFLNTIPSYSAEMLSLNMIIAFLFVISGMLFAIFFYMINVQKLGTYGILKAVGVKTMTLLRLMWVQMILVTLISLIIAIFLSQLITLILPEGMPYQLTLETSAVMAAGFFIIGFIGATLSGVQISKVEPMEAINQGGA